MDELLIRGGRLATPDGVVDAALLIRNGRIVAISDELPQDCENIIQLNGEYVLPGGVDVHVHLPWPTGSFISSDDFYSGTRAAAFGGTTTIIDFVIPEPGETLSAAVDQKRMLTESNAWVDYGLHINLRGDLAAQLQFVPALVKAGYASYKIFLAYEGFRVEDVNLPEVFQQVGMAGGMIDVHAENGLLADSLTAGLLKEGNKAFRFYPQARPAACEIQAVQKLLSLQEESNTPLHIHHVSTLKAAELIGAARQQVRAVSGETCPHYLLFDQTGYGGDPQLAAQLVCAPSIKTADDREGLWKALAEGWLSLLATDHCPYRMEQKETDLTDFTRTPGGIGGVELRLPLIFSEGVVRGRLSLEQFVDIWATNPAKTFGLYPRKGVIAVGSDADLVILDPNQEMTIHAGELKMNTDCTPYDGRQVTGWPTGTILRGTLLVKDGKQIAKMPGGEFIPRYLK